MMIKDDELSKRINLYREGKYDPEIGSPSQNNINEKPTKEKDKSNIFNINPSNLVKYLIELIDNIIIIAKIIIYGFAVFSVISPSIDINILSLYAVGYTVYELFKILNQSNHSKNSK